MQIHQAPVLPYERVGLDLCEVISKDGKKIDLLVMVDYYSGYIEVHVLTTTTAKNIIGICRRNFARYGIPRVVVSDNGPQFTGHEFKRFAKEWSFQHSTCSPYHHLGNGKSESAVKVPKRLYEKAMVGTVGIQKYTKYDGIQSSTKVDVKMHKRCDSDY